MRNESRPQPAAALAEYRLLRISRAGLKWRLPRRHSRFMPRHSRFSPVIPRFMPRHSRFMPRHSRFMPRHSRFSPVIPAKAGIHSACPREIGGDCGCRWDARERGCASLPKSGFTGLAGFSGFHFARLALFAITVNPPKTNTDKRLPFRKTRAARNPENPIIPRILILARRPPLRNSQKPPVRQADGTARGRFSLLTPLSSLFSPSLLSSPPSLLS